MSISIHISLYQTMKVMLTPPPVLLLYDPPNMLSLTFKLTERTLPSLNCLSIVFFHRNKNN